MNGQGHCLWRAECVGPWLPSCCLGSSGIPQTLHQWPKPCCYDGDKLGWLLHSLWRSNGQCNSWGQVTFSFSPTAREPKMIANLSINFWLLADPAELLLTVFTTVTPQSRKLFDDIAWLQDLVAGWTQSCQGPSCLQSSVQFYQKGSSDNVANNLCFWEPIKNFFFNFVQFLKGHIGGEGQIFLGLCHHKNVLKFLHFSYDFFLIWVMLQLYSELSFLQVLPSSYFFMLLKHCQAVSGMNLDFLYG